jgi:hypothetical protein
MWKIFITVLEEPVAFNFRVKYSHENFKSHTALINTIKINSK